MIEPHAQQPLIRVEGLYKIFGKKPLVALDKAKCGMNKDQIMAETGNTLGLENINLEIHHGEIFVIMGLSGSGKSTLIRHFNRLIEPTEGHIYIDGEDVMALDPKPLEDFRRHKMSMVFQRFGLMPHRTVIENIAYGLQIQGIPKVTRTEQAMHWLETVVLAGY